MAFGYPPAASDIARRSEDRLRAMQAEGRRAMEQGPATSAAVRQRQAAMEEEERVRGIEERTAAEARMPPGGPRPGSVLEGRYGVPESVPLDQLTPEQRRMIGHGASHQQVPRHGRGGDRVWDPIHNGGQGGYVPRAPDQTVSPGAPLRERAIALGIDTSRYGPDDEATLKADVAAKEARNADIFKRFVPRPVEGGGHRWAPGPEVAEQKERMNRDRFLREQYSRHGEELKRRGILPADLAALYDNPEAGPTHTDKARYVRDNLLSGVDAEMMAARREAATQNARDYNTARRFRTSEANIHLANSLQNAQGDPDAIFAVLSAAHAMNPNLGFGQMAAGVQAGQDAIDTAAAKAEPAPLSPINRAAQGQAEVQSMPNGAGKVTMARVDARAGGNVGVDQENAHVVTILARDASDVARKPSPSDGDKDLLREWTSAYRANASGSAWSQFTGWCRKLGIPPDQRAENIWYDMTGEHARGALARAWRSATGGSTAAPATAQAGE
jgi:hypothetical protein